MNLKNIKQWKLLLLNIPSFKTFIFKGKILVYSRLYNASTTQVCQGNLHDITPSKIIIIRKFNNETKCSESL